MGIESLTINYHFCPKVLSRLFFCACEITYFTIFSFFTVTVPYIILNFPLHQKNLIIIYIYREKATFDVIIYYRLLHFISEIEQLLMKCIVSHEREMCSRQSVAVPYRGLPGSNLIMLITKSDLWIRVKFWWIFIIRRRHLFKYQDEIIKICE